MYVILVYDVNVERLQRVHKLCRVFLHHIQNSVFEGELSLKDFNLLKEQINKIINPEEDSVILFKLRTNAVIDRQVMGLEKGMTGNIISIDEENLSRYRENW